MVKRTTSLFNLFCNNVVKKDVFVARFIEAKVSGIKLETGLFACIMLMNGIPSAQSPPPRDFLLHPPSLHLFLGSVRGWVCAEVALLNNSAGWPQSLPQARAWCLR